jgi:molybdopterin-guanine dinucleotide biosynthesis protein A
MIAGLVLAGGRSARMGGGDKCLIDLDGQTLIERVIGRLAPQVDGLAIAVGDKAMEGFARLPRLCDAVPGSAGPLAGLLAGLEWAAMNNYEHVLSTSCDVPFLPADLATRLRQATVGQDAAVASSGGQTHYVVGLWPVGLAPALRKQIVEHGRREAGIWAASLRTGIAVWPSDKFDPFHNINRPEDVETARRILSEFTP